ncbi:MAG: protoporphyrinogen oxidase [Acidobacteria bacterium]|nr:protoporphyrinogen oxidase [Acidobacteriota bacterium]MDA1235852.1 protoporphyrinogen oxidase [Acidobacteriota bacterium]
MSEGSQPEPLRPASVAVIGGGISGLTAAYELAKAGIACTIVDPKPALGGVIRTENAGGCLIEAGPDSFLAQKPWALELIKEVGLGDQVIGSNDHRRRTFVLRDGRLIQIPEGLQFMAPTRIAPVLKSPLLSVGAKLRMAAELLRRPSGARPDRSVAEFVTDHYGSEVNEYLAQPMLAGVYGAEPEALSVNAVLPRFVEIETRYGSLSRGLMAGMKQARSTNGPRSSLFLTLRGGMQTLTDALAARIAGKAKRVQGRAVGLERTNGRWTVQLEDASVDADAVILALPAYESAQLLAPIDSEITGPLRSIPYGSSITVGLVYERPAFTHPLTGFGFLVPRAEGRLLAACTWVGTKFDGRTTNDRPLLRAFLGGTKAQERMSHTPEKLVREVDAELKQLMQYSADPVEWRTAVWDRAMAQYPVGHAAIVAHIRGREAAIPGLTLIGNAFAGIGIPDCIRLARRAVRPLTGATAG